MYRTGKAAEMLGVNKVTIIRWIKKVRLEL